jgi:hypothetical protein
LIMDVLNMERTIMQRQAHMLTMVFYTLLAILGIASLTSSVSVPIVGCLLALLSMKHMREEAKIAQTIECFDRKIKEETIEVN